MAIPYLDEDPPYVIVEDGDWLSKISRDYLGDIWAYPKLAAINNIPNPDVIYVGQQIFLRAPGESSSSGSNVSSSGSQATINQFGMQSNSPGTLFATWSWSKGNTDHYEVEWCYDTGDDVWFVGNSGTTEHKQSTYNIPDNAKRVRFRVKPISTTYTSNNHSTHYWSASWSTARTYNVAEESPPVKPPVPDVEIDKYKLTATLDNLDVHADQIQFKIVKDSTTTFKTGTAKITTSHASYSCMVDAGGQYKVACRSYNGAVYSEWSDYSDNYTTIPAPSAGITTCRANSETSVYLEWAAVPSAKTYTIEYTTKLQYFDGSDQVTSITGVESTHYEKTGLESGQEYFFRVRAVNDKGDSSWSGIKSVVIGKKPSAPTTWSSTTTVVAGEELTLYWVHNSQDGSSQKYAELELYVDGIMDTYTIRNTTDEDEKDKTSYCVIDTQTGRIRWLDEGELKEFTLLASPGDGCTIQWRVRTSGVTNTYGDWSIQRTVDVYAPVTLELNLLRSVDEIGQSIDILEEFPCYVSALAGPRTQAPVGYHLSVISNEIYETVDRVGNKTIINKGEEVYSKYFDITDALMVELSAGNIDLENNISYTIVCTVSMNSGLTAEASIPFTVAWNEVAYVPNAEISLDEETYVTHIKPFCRSYQITNYKVDLTDGVYTKTDETVDLVYGTALTDSVTSTGEQVFEGVAADYNESNFKVIGSALEPSAPSENTIWVTTTIAVTGWIFSEAEPTSAEDGMLWFITSDSTSQLYPLSTRQYMSGSWISRPAKIYRDNAWTDQWNGKLYSPNTFYFCQVEESVLIDGVTLAVYRREFDGGFTELATGLVNGKDTFITDPHPALDYARYRIVATTNATGAVSYCDLPGFPVGGNAVIIQWDEAWSNFDPVGEAALAEPAWAGSMLKLPYNIDVSDSGDPDVELIEYIGREHPVSYHGTQKGFSSTWNVEIEADDEETLYSIRRLQNWMGNAYVREPSGSGYWASVRVSFSQKHRALTIPVTFTVTRVEGGV